MTGKIQSEILEHLSSTGILANLFGKEKLVVLHDGGKSCYIDLDKREIHLPLFNTGSKDLYTMLVAHEVSHALFTPQEGWHETPKKTQIPIWVYNVVEDIRVDKLIQKKYPGLFFMYARAYNELMKNNFFGFPQETLKDRKALEAFLNKAAFIDRLNMQSKLTSNIVTLDFPNETEKQLFNEAQNLSTWNDVEKLVAKIWEYTQTEPQFQSSSCKSQENSEQNQKNKKNKQSSSQQNSENKQNKQSQDSQEKVFGESLKEEQKQNQEEGQQAGNSENQGEAQEEVQESSNQCQKGQGEDNSNDLNLTSEESQDFQNPTSAPLGSEGGKSTFEQFSFEEFLKETGFTEKEFRKNLENMIVKIIEEKQSVLNGQITENDYKRWYSNRNKSQKELKVFNQVHFDAVFKFRKKHEYFIAAMKQEFDMKKSARKMMRKKIYKTGNLSEDLLHKYRTHDDIFITKTAFPKDQNHGIIFLIDLSSSMEDVIQSVFEQTILMTEFCDIAKIKYSVHGFSAKAMNYLYSSDDNHAYKTNIKSLMLQGNRAVFDSGGTPLVEAALCLRYYAKNIQQEWKVEKLNLVMISDGAGSSYFNMGDKSHLDPQDQIIIRYPNGEYVIFQNKKDFYYNQSGSASLIIRELSQNVFDNTQCFFIDESNYLIKSLERDKSKLVYQDTKFNKSCDPSVKDHLIKFNNYSGFDDYYYINFKNLVRDSQNKIKSRVFFKSIVENLS